MEKNLISFTKFSKEILESGDIDPDYHFMREYAAKEHLSKSALLNWICLKSVVYRSVSELEILTGGKKFKDVKFGNERNKARNKAAEYYASVTNFMDFAYSKLRQDEYWDALVKVHGVGPWARWKIIDLLSCVYGYHIDLSKVDFRGAYEFPLKGLNLINGNREDYKLNLDYEYKVSMKEAWIQMPKVKATPHNNGRGVRINELETCLCKYHSYVHGHYYPGKDLEHLRKDIAASDLPQLKKFKWSL